MGRIAAIGAAHRVQGFALAGAVTVAAETPDAVRRAWAALDPDVALVILTPSAAEALGEEPHDPSSTRLTAVMPP